MIEDLTRWK